MPASSIACLLLASVTSVRNSYQIKFFYYQYRTCHNNLALTNERCDTTDEYCPTAPQGAHLILSLCYFKYFEIELSISQFATMENDPLKLLIELYKSEGYVGREAVEKAEAELDKRRHQRQLELHQSAGKNHRLLFDVPFCVFAFGSFNIYD